MTAQPFNIKKGGFSTLQELYDFIIDQYEMETNIESEEFREILSLADVIFIGETHDNAQHTQSNGALINAIWNEQFELMIEHEPIGAAGQLVCVEPNIARHAKQWDFTDTHAVALFEKLVELSEKVADDFYLTKILSSKQLLSKGTKLIDDYLIHPSSVENGWALIDHQMARILDERSGEWRRIELMLKQAYLRVWVFAAYETIDRFLRSLEMELEERNGWMTKMVAKALFKEKRVLLIAGSEHFSETITNVKRKEIENPILTYLRDNQKKYLILQPMHDESIEQAKEVCHELQEMTEAEITELEREAIHLCEQMILSEDELKNSGLQEQYLQEMEELKSVCLDLIESLKIESHSQALNAPYLVGAIALRVEKLAKIIQVWNVIAEIALAHNPWLDECEDVLGIT